MLRRYILVVGMLAALNARAWAGSWSSTTPLPDGGYDGHALSYSSGFLYQTGGQSYNGGILDGVHVLYAPVQSNGMIGAWSYTAPLPEAVFYHAGVAASGVLYVLGGEHYTDAAGIGVSNVAYFTKIQSDGSVGAWQTTSALPQPLYFPSAAVWNGTIYVTGGANVSGLTNAVYSARINPDGSLGAWVAQKPLPDAVYTHSEVSNGTLYVLGGTVDGGNLIQNTVYYSKINADGTLAGWATTTPMPQPLSNLAAIIANGRVYEIGGWNGSNVVADVNSAGVASDGTLGAWSPESVMPDGLTLHAAANTGTFIIVTGGVDAVQTRSAVYSFALPAGPPPPAPPPPPSDVLPPRTTLSIGAPEVPPTPFVSPATLFTLSAVDDMSVVYDSAGAGVAATYWAVDSTASFTTYSGPFSIAADGAHWIYDYSVDKAGNVEAVRASSAAVDGTAPASSLSIGAPQALLASGAVLVGPGTLLAVSAQDPVVNGVASGVSQALFGVDGAPLAHYAGPFTLPASDGPHTIVLQASDAVGNTEGAHSTTVYRDGTPPATTLALSVPAVPAADGGAPWLAGASLASFTAADPVVGGVASGVRGTWYGIDGAAATPYSGPFGLPEGAHALSFYSADNVGNAEAARSVSYRVDLTPPQTTLSLSGGVTLFGVDLLTTQTQVSLSAIDPVSNGVASGVKQILYSVDGGADRVYAGPFSLAAGRHVVSYGAVDAAGNAETRASVTLAVGSFLADALAGLDAVTLSGGAGVTGDVRTNGAFSASGRSSVSGNVTAMTIDTDGRSTIRGAQTQGEATLSASYDLAAASAWAQANNDDAAIAGYLSNGALSLSGKTQLRLPAGSYYVTGLTLSGQSALSVAGGANIFVHGPISVSGQAALNGSGDAVNLWIVSESGDVSLTGQSRSAFNLYAPNSNFSASGGDEYAGRVLGKTAALSGRALQPSTTSLPPPSHKPGSPKHWTAAVPQGGAGTAGPGRAGGGDSPVASSSLAQSAPSGGIERSGSSPSYAAPADLPGARKASAERRIPTAPPPAAAVSSHAALALVTPQGSALHAKDGSGVVIPQGAPSGNLAVSVAAASTADPRDLANRQAGIAKLGLVEAAKGVEFGPEGTQFSKPVTIELPYSRAALPGGVAEASLAVHYWNRAAQAWQRLDSSVDTVNQVVRAQTSHFSLYQILGGGAPASAPAPVGGLGFGQVYVYPNPSRPGQRPTFHIEAGSADAVDVRIYDLSGRLKDQLSLSGPLAAYEAGWDASGAGSGVYIYVITASQNGGGRISTKGKFAVIK